MFQFPQFMFSLINDDTMSNISASEASVWFFFVFFLLRLLCFLMKIVPFFRSKLLSVYNITGILGTTYQPFAYCTPSKKTWILCTKRGVSPSLELWSQINLKPCDFSDLQITGQFDYHLGTGQFLRIFSCMGTFRTGAGQHLYIIKPADARSGTVQHGMVPS